MIKEQKREHAVNNKTYEIEHTPVKNYFWLKILVSGILLATLVFLIDIRKIAEAFNHIDAVYIITAVFLLVPNLFLQWCKWHLLVRLLHPQAAPRQTFSSLLKGISLGLVTPGRTGELGRGWFLPFNSKAPLVGYTFLDKIYTQAAIILIGIPALLYNFNAHISGRIFLAVLLWGGYGFFAATVLTAAAFPEKWAGWCERKNWKLFERPAVRNLITGLQAFDRGASVKIFILSWVFIFVCVLQFYVIVSSFERISMLKGFGALAGVMLMSVLAPVSFGNLGIRELSAVYFLGRIGLSEESAFDSSLILFTINILLPALAGYTLIVIHRKTEQPEASIE